MLGLAHLSDGPLRRSGQRKVIHSVIEQTPAQPQQLADLTMDLRKLTHWIDDEIKGTGPGDIAHPDPKRLETIERWAEFLQPYNAPLLEIALRNPGDLSAPVRRLLCYTRPDSVLVDGLRRELVSYSPRAMVAARLLHEHRMLSAEDRSQLAALVDAQADPTLRDNLAISLSEFGLTHGIEVVARVLIRPLDPLDLKRSLFDVARIVELAENLGPRAAVLIPALESKIGEVKSILPDHTRDLEYALGLLKGSIPTPTRVAMNGSGYLDSREDLRP